jgi:hypothetical protein
MKAELLEIVKEYAVFETAVRQQITDFCASHCSNCEQVCCRPEYCRENIDSPFLNLLSSKIRRKAAYDAEHGWLASTGCALSTGRPPVCYQFNCKKIIDGLPDDQQRYFFQVLSNLVPHIGKLALGPLHLVEIMDADKLKRVKIARFGKRLAEARQALQIIQSINGNGFPAAQSLADLSKIVPIPRALAG